MNKLMIILGIVLLACGCLKEADHPLISRVTANSMLVCHQEDHTFDLWVRQSWGENIWITEVEQIGWNEHEILVYGRNQNEEGWVYIIDDAPFVKSWGTYNNKEFLIRAKELGIENKFELTKPAAVFDRS
jgi:hypothetical protein